MNRQNGVLNVLIILQSLNPITKDAYCLIKSYMPSMCDGVGFVRKALYYLLRKSNVIFLSFKDIAYKNVFCHLGRPLYGIFAFCNEAWINLTENWLPKQCRIRISLDLAPYPLEFL